MGDVGLFGPDSVAWHLHADPVMLIGGMRALLVQALEPRAMAAVDQHSRFREDPWGRLERTTSFVMTTIYGDTAAAEAACDRVRKVHARIRGVDPVTGQPYAANDPDLLLWIHAVELESFIGELERLLGRRAVKEYLPMQAGDVPATFASVDRLAAATGFAPTTPIAEGLARFVAWYRQYYGVQ